jgi:chitin synthase
MSNVYLAEDRVLCLNIVASANKRYTLRYVRQSKAVTDVPANLVSLIYQRRRWTNGSWHALVRNLKQFHQISKTKHNCCKKFWLQFQFLYFLCNVAITWLTAGTLFLIFVVLMNEIFVSYFGETEDEKIRFSSILSSLYIFFLVFTLILSMGVDAKRAERLFQCLAF